MIGWYEAADGCETIASIDEETKHMFLPHKVWLIIYVKWILGDDLTLHTYICCLLSHSVDDVEITMP